jgi:hypothetical protein
VEQDFAQSGVDAGPSWRNGREVGSVVAWLGFWLDGGDGFAVFGEFGARAGAVVRRCGTHLFVGHLRSRLAVTGEAEFFLLFVANVVALMLGKVDGRDLECIEQQAGSAEVDVVAGDGLCYFGDGALNVEA